MQEVVFDTRYTFTPPNEGRLLKWILIYGIRWYLNRFHGIVSIQCRGLEHLKRSVAEGHGILITPNHCRLSDPPLLGTLWGQVGREFFTMASSHLFVEGGVNAWLMKVMGAFSIHRESLDHESLRMAVKILKEARYPLVVFPEGALTRTNDRLNNLQRGVPFIARTAAKQRAVSDPPGKVVIHPLAIRYRFAGDLNATLSPVLDDFERRLFWRPNRELSLIDRVALVGTTLLSLKEVEYLGRTQTGTIDERIRGLINHLLAKPEMEWLQKQATQDKVDDEDIVARVKRLRMLILPDMVAGKVTEDERQRRWRQLNDLTFAQQLSLYPPDYIQNPPIPERLLETVERIEEDLTGKARIHRPLHAFIHIGEALEVQPDFQRGKSADPLLATLRERLEAMLDESRAR